MKAQDFHILYADDEPINLRMFRSLFEDEYTIHLAQNARKALAILHENPIHLVISDQRMPQMSGVEFLSEVNRVSPEVPCILLTAYADIEAIKRAINELQIEHYLSKPYDPEEMRLVLARFFELRSLEEEKGELSSVVASTERKFQEVFHSITDLFIRVDQGGVCVLVSPSVERLLGYEVQDVEGHDLSSLFAHPKQLEELKKAVQTGLVNNYEVLLKHKNGNELVFSLNAKLFKDPLGKAGLECVGRDISELKHAEQEIWQLNASLEQKVVERTAQLESAREKLTVSLEKERELNKLKSRFVSTASHQFRTPLTVIEAGLEVLNLQKERMEVGLQNDFDRIYARVVDQIERMTTLMDDVLSLGNVNAGKLPVRLAWTDLNEICTGVVERHNGIQKDGRSMTLLFSGDPFKIWTDGELLNQALSNFVSNAFKYSKGKASPEMRLTYQPEGVAIEVQDFGIGIAKKEQERIFEPFHRADNALDAKGSGLGLSIAHEYIQLIGGALKVVSTYKKGSTFSVALPFGKWE